MWNLAQWISGIPEWNSNIFFHFDKVQPLRYILYKKKHVDCKVLFHHFRVLILILPGLCSLTPVQQRIVYGMVSLVKICPVVLEKKMKLWNVYNNNNNNDDGRLEKLTWTFGSVQLKKKHDEECLSFLPYLYSPIIIPLGVKYSWMGREAINSQSMNS